MKKTLLTAALVAALTAALLPLGAQAAPKETTPRAEWMQVSLIIADGINVGGGLRLSGTTKVALNLDMRTPGPALSSSLVFVHPQSVFFLSDVYAGLGLTYSFPSSRFSPHILIGGDFNPFFAEYEWVMAPVSYGKVRSGIKWRF